MKRLLILGLGLVALAAAPPPAAPVKKGLDAFQGEWEVQWIEVEGTKHDWRKGVLAFRGKQRLSRKHDGKEYEKLGSIEIDPSCDPKVIDFHPAWAKNKDDRTEGIYKIDGDVMFWCVSIAEGEKNRPLEFRTKAGSKTMLVKLRRLAKGQKRE
jgi:uncharacterized protein (TIGR03067 family)